MGIEIVVDVGYNHVSHTCSVAQFVDGFVGHCLREQTQLPSRLSIVEQHFLNLEDGFVGRTERR